MSESEKRRLIQHIQADASLTSSQKMIRIQEVMHGTRTGAGPPKEEEPPFPPKEEVSYQKGDAKTLGCAHYRRNCKVLSPCCSNWVVCRLCHNEGLDDHEIDRHAITTMLCMLCQTEQPIAQTCTNCNETMAEYFCAVCNLLDSTPGKNIFHCDKCGICRIGKRDEYVHCDRCGTCFHKSTMDKHTCTGDALKQNCPICFEYLFTSVRTLTFLPCGHPMHVDCCNDLLQETQNGTLTIGKCPICQKAISMRQLKSYRDILNEVIPKHPMPKQYRREVTVACNECNQKSLATYHFYGMKCGHCGHYNTSLTNPEDGPMDNKPLPARLLESDSEDEAEEDLEEMEGEGRENQEDLAEEADGPAPPLEAPRPEELD